MALYQSGTATGPNNLLDTLRQFLIDNSWTVNGWTTVGAGYRLHVEKEISSSSENMFFNFRSAIAETGDTLIAEDNLGGAGGTVTGICINGSTGYSGGSDWDKQPGYTTNPNATNKSTANVMTPMSVSAIPAYYFYAVGDSVHVVVEVTAGVFQFMSFGCLVKQGEYTGGQYYSASWDSRAPQTNYLASSYGPKYFTYNYNQSSYLNGAVYVDADGTEDWRVADGDSDDQEIVWSGVPSSPGLTGTHPLRGMCTPFYEKAPNSYNNISAACPIYTLLYRSDDNYSLIGWPEGVRFLNVTNYTPAQELTYGDDTWMVFESDSGDVAPGWPGCGFAFKKEV